MIHNKLFLVLPTVAILATVLTLATFTIPTFAQSEGTNQTMKNMNQESNQTLAMLNEVDEKAQHPGHRHRHGGGRAQPAVPRRVLRPRDRLRGHGAHPRRQGRARRDGPGAASPAAGSRSPCRATAPRRSAGRCPTPTTRSRAATSASTRPTSCSAGWEAGLEPYGTHHAHALHSPYWWLKCAVRRRQRQGAAVKAYHKLLVWDIMKGRWSPGSPSRRSTR